MDTRRLEETSRLVGATSWPAIASGAVIAFALQTLLLLFGVAFGMSIGDKALEGGYQLWSVIVELAAIAVGAALAARLSDARVPLGGAAAGVMTWAVTLVLGSAFHGLGTGLSNVQLGGSTGVWAAFLGAALSLGAAIVGGALAAGLGRRHPPIRTEAIGPGSTQPA